MACIDFYFARCMNIFNSLLAQLVKYDVHTTRKIKIDTRHFYHILSLSYHCYVTLVSPLICL